MPTQTYPAGGAPRVILSDIQGDLEIEARDERTIEVETEGRVDQVGQVE